MENAQAIALMMGLAFAGLVIGVCLDLYRHRKSVTRDTAAAPDAVVTDTPPAPKNKGGRPKGSKNKPKAKTKKTTRRRA
jgi:hypothetical protein